jgi:DNA end-binding protein Ku
MPARTVWTGSLTFGLVSLPVGVYPATRDQSVHFNQFEAGTSDRIRYRKVNERTGQEVPADRIARGVDLGGGEYVIVSDDELEALEPRRSHEIEVVGFIDLAEIDPVYFRSTYYLAPSPKGPDKAYALLRAAMRRSGKVAVARLIMRGREYLVAIRPGDEVLILETLYFADEVRDAGRELPPLPAEDAVTERELEMADLLIDSMAMAWDPNEYDDTYRQEIEALVERKREGKEVVARAEPDEPSPIVDLMAALEASMRRRGGEVAARGSESGSGRRKATGTTKRATGATKKKAAAKTTRSSAKSGTAKKSTKKAAAKKAPAKKAGGLRRVS